MSLRNSHLLAAVAGAAIAVAFQAAGVHGFWFWVGVLALSIAAGLWFSRRAVAAVRLARQRLQRMVTGDYTVTQAFVSADPEISLIASASSVLAERLANSREESRQSSAEIQSVLDDLADAVLVVDSSGRLTRVNPAAGVLFGHIPHLGMVGKTVMEGTFEHTLAEMVEECLATQSVQEALVEVHGPRTRWVAATAIPRLSDAGDLLGALLVLHDITELRRMEEVQREFIANASHELRTPIAGLQVMAESLLNGGLQDPEAGPDFARAIRESAERLGRLVDDLLFLNVHGAADDEDRIAVSLQEFAASICARMTPQAAQKEITLACEPGEDVMVEADPQDLTRAVVNLVDNAVRYTDAGGRVTFRTGRQDNEAFIAVSDNGIGIPSDHTERIFDRFHRVDIARSRASGGTGLGLSIVREIVTSLGGSVEVDSTVGEGSTFTIYLPATSDASPQ